MTAKIAMRAGMALLLFVMGSVQAWDSNTPLAPALERRALRRGPRVHWCVIGGAGYVPR